LPLRKAILFGSYAEGRQTASSDVDLLIVYDDPKVKDDYIKICRRLAVEGLEPHAYTLSEYNTLKASRNWLIEEAERKGIVIYAREQG